MGEVAVDEVFLGVSVVEKRAGLQEDLDDLDILWQLALEVGLYVVEIRQVAEDPLHEGVDEALLQVAAALGSTEGNPGDYGQFDSRVSHRAPVQFVEKMRGTTEASGDHHLVADVLQQRFHALLEIREVFR